MTPISSISGVELERLMIIIVCVINALLLLFLIIGTWHDESEQLKAIKLLKLVPDDLFFKQGTMLESSPCCGSDLHLILLLAKSTLRDAHPVFGMCLQASKMGRSNDENKSSDNYLTTLKSLIVWGKAEHEHDEKVKNILKNIQHGGGHK